MSLPHGAAEVAIVIPTYDRPDLVEEAVAAALSQAGPAVEVIVVDDGSPRPPALLHGERVELVTLSENQGRAAARNAGLARVTAPLVLFCDDDDLLAPAAVAQLARGLADHPLAVAAVGARERRVRGAMRRMPHPGRVSQRDVWSDLLAGWSAVPGQVLIRTAVLRGIGGWAHMPPLEDRDVLLRLAERGPVVLVPEVVITYTNDPLRYQTDELEARRRALLEAAALRAPSTRRRSARRQVRAGAQLRRAERWQREGRRWRAIGALGRAALIAPELLASPLTGPRLLFTGLDAILDRR